MLGVKIVNRNHATSVAGLIADTGEFKGMAIGAKIFHDWAFYDIKSNMSTTLDALNWAPA